MYGIALGEILFHAAILLALHLQEIKWDPPKRANGNLTSYVIFAELVPDDGALLEQRNYCMQRECQQTVFTQRTMNFICARLVVSRF